MDAGVANLLGPGDEAIVELLKAADALSFGLKQEPLSDIAVEPLLFTTPSR
jgi:hypothetical protein